MKKSLLPFLFYIALLFPLYTLSQVSTTGSETSKGEAKDSFIYGDWKRAIEEYNLLIKDDPKNPTYLYRLGISYLETYTDRKLAIQFLDLAIKNGCNEKDAPFMLAKAYQKNHQFDIAIQKYEIAIKKNENLELVARAKLYQEMCRTAKKQIANPLQGITIENMGPSINSPGLDFTPYVDEKESTLLFTTKRQKGNGGYKAWDGLYTSDIFIAKEKKGKWQKAKSIGGAIGTSHDEAIVGLTPSGSVLFTDFLEAGTKGDIQMAPKQGKQYLKNKSFSDDLNLGGTIELSACLNTDETIIYFASDRPGGKGGLDIYYSSKLPDGTWSLEKNLEEINTEWDDAYPHLLPGDSILYFSSEGHGSMGGFDIFKTSLDAKTSKWKKPQNIGYPINDVDDNHHLALSKTGRYGYFSAYRPDDKTQGCGELDIYQVTFNGVEQRLSTIVGSLYEEIPIDYNTYQDFIIMSKDSGVSKQRFPAEYTPPLSSGWAEIERKKVKLKPGFKYSFSITLSKGGQAQTFGLTKLPADHQTYEFVAIKNQMIPDKDYKKPPKNAPKFREEQIKDAFVQVHHKETGELYGEYLLSPSSGNFVLALKEEEVFIATFEVEGFDKTNTEFTVTGKASYKPFVIKKFKMKRNIKK